MTRISIRADRVATGTQVLSDAVIVVEGSRIVSVSAGAEQAEAAGVHHRGWVLPGFVDTHVHGGGGADYTSADGDQIRRAIAFHRRNGTTSTFASLVTDTPDAIVRQTRALVPLVRSGELAGIHLEGPFLSKQKKGAHEPSLLRDPEPALVERLLEAGDGAIAMVTLAPELPGGFDAIRAVTAAGAVAAIGHTDGDERIAVRALDAGARVATHTFNAMRSIHHREPGPVPRLLSDERCLVELICDGVHIHPDVLIMAIDAAGPQRVAMITDAMGATGMADGSYRLGTLTASVIDGVARLQNPDGSLGSIAGSTLTTAGAVELLRGRGIGLGDLATMAATSPARWHGLAEVGELAAGFRADLVLLDDAGRLQRVMAAGDWVSSAGEPAADATPPPDGATGDDHDREAT